MNYYLFLGLVLFFYMCFWFVVSVLKKRNDIADLAWGLGFVFISWFAFFLSGFSTGALLVNILVTIWGLRLAIHISSRLSKKAEDYRYQAWRKEWGSTFYWRSFLQVFLLQGFLLYLIALPILRVNQVGFDQFNYLHFLGTLVWFFGFIFEAISDQQLKDFILNPKNKGKIMISGLWRYSRHPNYFGEVTLWWGIFLIAVSLPNSWFTIIGPLTITVLIIFISGIPLLEKKYQGRADFEKYKSETSIFLPLPHKK